MLLAFTTAVPYWKCSEALSSRWGRGQSHAIWVKGAAQHQTWWVPSAINSEQKKGKPMTRTTIPEIRALVTALS